MRKGKVDIDRKCIECEIDCKCGCQSNIYALPLEVIERILWYEDLLTLVALEKVSRFFLSVVSDFWISYCKRNRLLKKPIPLCSDWSSESRSIYSYKKTKEQVSDEAQRWRIMAIRVYLKWNSRCVICMSICDDTEQNYTYGDDVLLCPSCLPNFTITINHDLLHVLNSLGVSNSKLHINFGTILRSQFIKALKSSVQDGDLIMEQLQSYLQHKTPTFSPRRELLSSQEGFPPMPMLPQIIISSSNEFNFKHRSCCCSVQQCSGSSRRYTLQTEFPVVQARQRPFYISLGVLSFINVFLLVHCAVLREYSKLINITQEAVVNFIWISYSNIALLIFMMAYIITTFYIRRGKRGWNQSFHTTLQCFLLACALVEFAEGVLARQFINNYTSISTSFMKSGISSYNQSEESRGKIDWIQSEFSCCGFSSNATADWLNVTLLFPMSCCPSNNWKCSEAEHFRRNCLAQMSAAVSPVLTSFAWTSILSGVFHSYFILYVCIIFHVQRTNAN